MRFNNIDYKPLDREITLNGINIDLHNDFFVHKIIKHSNALYILFKSQRNSIPNVSMVFFEYNLLECNPSVIIDDFQANFIDIIRSSWDSKINYTEKQNEMLLTIYFDNDLESITLTCKYFDIDFI